ncbi:hypothetical protein, partial [Thiolapillus sp.]
SNTIPQQGYSKARDKRCSNSSHVSPLSACFAISAREMISARLRIARCAISAARCGQGPE